jgi:hypothetical protein
VLNAIQDIPAAIRSRHRLDFATPTMFTTDGYRLNHLVDIGSLYGTENF